jgi:hypothetical protein
MTERPATSRWRSSAISFGPVGRLTLTALVTLPVWWLFGANVVSLAMSYQIGYFFAAFAWTLFVVPLILRDVWKRVPDRDAPSELVLTPEPKPLLPGESIHDRKAPSRW